MSDCANILRLARKLARASARRHNARLKNPSQELDLAREIKTLHLSTIPPALWDELDALLDHNPSLGLALAQVLHAIAKQKRSACLRAHADLVLIRALNVCGEFKQTLALCPAAARRFEKRGEMENTAHVWLEAAWAETWLGDLHTAQTNLAHASVVLAQSENPGLELKHAWIQTRILRSQGARTQALAQFRRLYDELCVHGNTLDAARMLREIGWSLVLINPADALSPLEQARKTFAQSNCPVEAALCDYFMAQALIDLNRFERAAQLLRSIQSLCQRHALRYLDALCDLERGYLAGQRGEPQHALDCYLRARRMFEQLGAVQEISSCDLNIGWQYLQLNRYAEAYERFADAAATAVAMGMQTKAANCFMNMGMALERQGRYASALAQLQRARVVFARETMRDRLIELDLHLGLVHFQLGEYASALRALNAAYAVSTHTGISSRVAQSELYRARVWLAQKKHARARQALLRARAMFRRNGQTLMVALCDRQLAETENNARAARRRLASGQRHFAGNGMVIDAALCDVTYAELAMERKDWRDAETCLRKADAVLRDSFPEHHARVLHGFARVALAQHNWRTALDHYAQAAQTLAQLRGGLALETLSNSFFAARAQVIQEGLECARRHHAATHALALIEASKAQSFLGLLDAPARESKEANEHVRALEERERALAARLIKQRRQLIAPAQPEKSAQRDVPLADEDAALRALRALTQEYEHVAQELRLARRGLKANPARAPFALDEFRACANAQWGDAWTALDYFFANGKLYIVCADAEGVTLHAARWTRTDCFHLEQATTNHPQLRELIYNGTLNGQPAPAKNDALEYLAARLLPDALRTRHNPQTLIVSPHAQLHQLPFQALEWHGAPLLEHFTCVYAPNLQTLFELARHKHPRRKNARTLVCGAENFSDVPALTHTRKEVANLARTQPRATTLWQNEATRTTLMQWNERDALARYDVLHFATHALLEPRAPHTSRLLLADGALNVLELTAWKLDARLVTLSACSSATGKGGSGDEILGLARAFFYAGARAVVASLWNVDDASTAALMNLFYRHLRQGKSLRAALRDAQLEMKRQGYSAFHWAAFVAMGDV